MIVNATIPNIATQCHHYNEKLMYSFIHVFCLLQTGESMENKDWELVPLLFISKWKVFLCTFSIKMMSWKVISFIRSSFWFSISPWWCPALPPLLRCVFRADQRVYRSLSDFMYIVVNPIPPTRVAIMIIADNVVIVVTCVVLILFKRSYTLVNRFATSNCCSKEFFGPSCNDRWNRNGNETVVWSAANETHHVTVATATKEMQQQHTVVTLCTSAADNVRKNGICLLKRKISVNVFTFLSTCCCSERANLKPSEVDLWHLSIAWNKNTFEIQWKMKRHNSSKPTSLQSVRSGQIVRYVYRIHSEFKMHALPIIEPFHCKFWKMWLWKMRHKIVFWRRINEKSITFHSK